MRDFLRGQKYLISKDTCDLYIYTLRLALNVKCGHLTVFASHTKIACDFISP